MKVIGTGEINVFALMTPEDMLSPSNQSWVCEINGNTTPSVATAQNTATVLTTVPICSGSIFDSNNNIFSFSTATGGSVINVIFDYLEFRPVSFPTVQTYNHISVSSDDKSIEYNGDWSNSSGTVTASIENDSMKYTFSG